MDPNSNILKPKNTSPIRKQKSSMSSKPLASVNALVSVTQNKPRKAVRKRVDNDENKENCSAAPRPTRTGGLGVNGNIGNAKKNPKPVKSLVEARDGRLPLRELPLNGFLDRLKKSDVAPSVEIVVCGMCRRY
jgi:hypothetical protein